MLATKAAITVAAMTSVIACCPAYASVVLGNTRVIYSAAEVETTVRLVNDGKLPALTQAWLDRGDASASPASIEVPFVVTPPIARIDPGKRQTLRIVYSGEPLPADRESVFYLNVLEMPPKDGSSGANLLQMAFRTRIKLFYRPENLSVAVGDAPARLVWRAARLDGKQALEAANPTPYHVTLTDVTLASEGKVISNEDGGMLHPGETRRFLLRSPAQWEGGGDRGPEGAARVRFGVINDYGGTSYHEATLSHASGE